MSCVHGQGATNRTGGACSCLEGYFAAGAKILVPVTPTPTSLRGMGAVAAVPSPLDERIGADFLAVTDAGGLMALSETPTAEDSIAYNGLGTRTLAPALLSPG